MIAMNGVHTTMTTNPMRRAFDVPLRFLCIVLALLLLLPQPAHAARKTKSKVRSKAVVAAPAQPATPMSVFCIETGTGLVTYEQEADRPRPPASMVKMMMMLMLAEGVDAGKWRLEDEIDISAHAEGMGGTQVNLKAGERWPIGELAMAIAIASANDASMALAEGLWGGVKEYLEAANARAVELGMNNTVYHSVHGLPPDDKKSFDMTTARDMARLALEYLKHERIRTWVQTREYAFRNGTARHASTNKLLWRMEDCDGLKTGYIKAAGFCITATAERDGVRLVCVVMGAPTLSDRFRLAEDFMERGFARVQRVRVVGVDQHVGPIPVRLGIPDQLSLQPEHDVWVTIRSEDKERLEIWAEHPERLIGPLTAGTPVGQVQVLLDGEVLASSALLVPRDVEARGWMLTIEDGVARWVGLDNPPPSAAPHQ